MKNKLIITIACFLLGAESAVAEEKFSSTVPLRYGSQYFFTQSVTNETPSRIGLRNFAWEFTEERDYNGGDNPEFPWTENISGREFIIGANETDVLVARSTPLYSVKHFPPTRSADNIVIKYTITYFTEVDGEWVGPKYDIRTQPYEITYCGDGVIDQYKDAYTG